MLLLLERRCCELLLRRTIRSGAGLDGNSKHPLVKHRDGRCPRLRHGAQGLPKQKKPAAAAKKGKAGGGAASFAKGSSAAEPNKPGAQGLPKQKKPGMPPFTTRYAPNIKRRDILKSVTHRAYGRCVSQDDKKLPTSRASLGLIDLPPPRAIWTARARSEAGGSRRFPP